MCDTQSPNCALLAVQATDPTAKEQRTDHKSKSSVDMQYCEQNGRKQYGMHTRIFTFENSQQTLMNDTLGEYLLQ